MATQRESRIRMIGAVGWAVIIALVLVWEGIGLRLGHDRWPTLSNMLHSITRSPAGRLILFSLWLWLGWHLFVRGWRFFLRG